MSWIILVIAALFEVGLATGLKASEGFTKLWPSIGTVVSIILSLGLLSVAMKGLPLGTAYAVWVGIGTVFTVLVGIFYFGESADPGRLVSLALIVIGIIGLKLTSPH